MSVIYKEKGVNMNKDDKFEFNEEFKASLEEEIGKEEKVKNKKKWKKPLIIVSAIVLIPVLIGTILFFYFFGGLNMKKFDLSDEALGITNAKDKDKRDIVNIALFGVDTRVDDYSGRSDTIMILTIDNELNKIKLTSIARDTYLTIPGRSEKTKVNHAYSYGGAELAIETLNYNFDLNIRDYATINFHKLAQVIDMVGGVEVYIDEDELVDMNQSLPKDKRFAEAGTYLLDGATAVTYTRIRYNSGGDSARTNRQREVLSALYNKGKQMSVVQYPSLIRQVLPLVETSLEYSEILGYSMIMSKGNIPLELAAYPNANSNAEGKMIDGIWYYVYDIDKAAESINAFIYDDIFPYKNEE